MAQDERSRAIEILGGAHLVAPVAPAAKKKGASPMSQGGKGRKAAKGARSRPRSDAARRQVAVDEPARFLAGRDQLSQWTFVIRSGLPSASFERAAESLEVSVSDLSQSLRIPARTLHRRLARRERLTPEETERSVRVARALARAQQLLGDENGRAWLLEPSRALGGEIPVTLFDTADGFGAVMDELGRLEYGLIS
jgi:putative toxin-antitoxin system antitoxin component (TIGR02293 family)